MDIMLDIKVTLKNLDNMLDTVFVYYVYMSISLCFTMYNLPVN